MLTLAGVTVLIIIIAVYAYFYMTLPKLHEHFVSERKKEEALRREYDALKKKYSKNRHERLEVRGELQTLKSNLHYQVKEKDVAIYKSGLLEYDIEKALAAYNKVKLEVDAVKSYYTNLQKEYIRVGKDLSALKEEHALDKEKCSLVDTKLIKSKRDYEALIKVVQGGEIQLREVKKQLDLMVAKKDPLATTLAKVLVDRQKEKAVIDKKLAEAGVKLKIELKKQQELKRKLSINEDKLTRLKKQQSLGERQLVQTKEKINKEAAEKKRREIELKQIKESISIRDGINRNLQVDVNKAREKYNKVIRDETNVVKRINDIRTKTVGESLEIRKLRESITKLTREAALAEENRKKKLSKKPCSKPVSYLPLTANVKDIGSSPQDSTALGNIEFKTIQGRKCAYFNNRMGTYVKLPNPVKASFTVSFWFLVKSGGYYTMVSRTDGSLNDPMVQFDVALPGKLVGPYLGLPSRWTGVSSKTRLELNNWYNVTLVVSGQRATSYLNGIKEGQVDGKSPMPDRPFWIIGRSGDAGRAADVAIAHFALWDRTLSEQEVESYYKETLGDTLPQECALPSKLTIVEASYGKNCNSTLKGNRTKLFRELTNGKSSLDYIYNYTRTGGDPAVGCGKTLEIVYKCDDGNEKTYKAPAEAGFDARVILKC